MRFSFAILSIIICIVYYLVTTNGQSCASTTDIALNTFTNHTGLIVCLLLLSDGTFVSGSYDRTIKRWNPITGDLLNTFIGHSGSVLSLVLLNDGTFASGSYDNTIKRWNSTSGALLNTFKGHYGGVYSLLSLEDGTFVSGSYDNTVKRWNSTSGALLKTFAGHSGCVYSLLSLDDGTFVSGSGSGDNTIKRWNSSSGTLLNTFTGHNGTINTILSLNDGTFASGSEDNTIKRWNATTGALLKTFAGHAYGISSLILMYDGTFASGSRDNTIKRWNLFTGALLNTFVGHAYPVSSLLLLNDGTFTSGSGDSTIKRWNPTSGALLSTYAGHTSSIHTLVLLNDGMFASGSVDNTIKRWNPTSLALLKILTGHIGRVSALLLLNDGTFVSGSVDNTIKRWNPITGALLNTFTGHTSYINSLLLLNDGTFASASDDNTIKRWNPITGALLNTFIGHSDRVLSLLLLDDGTFVSGSYDQTIKKWNPITGALLNTHPGENGAVNSFLLLNDGTLVCGSYYASRYNASTLTFLNDFQTHALYFQPVTSLLLLNDGTFVSGSGLNYGGSLDYTIKRWNVTAGALLNSFAGHADYILALLLLSDGTFVSGSNDNTIKRWNATSGALLNTFSGHKGGVFSLLLLNDGTFVSGSADSTIRRWNPVTGALLNTFAGNGGITISSLLLLNNGSFASADDSTINLWLISCKIPGSYCLNVKSQVGFVCPSGYYCPGNYASPIISPVGTYSLEFSSFPTNCSVGTFSNITGASLPCSNLCPQGSYCPSGSAVSIPCAIGTYSPSIGSPLCVPCSIGFFCPANSASQTICAEGNYSLANSGSCSVCVAGNYCTSGIMSPCNAGYYSSSGQNNCTLCLVGHSCLNGIMTKCVTGTFSIAAGSSSCKSCSAGYICSDTSITACLPGFYSDGTFTECAKCPSGSICPNNGTSTPSPCPLFHYSEAGQTSCLICPDSKVCDNGIPRDCLSGFHCNNGVALPCAKGTYSDGALSYCKPCTVGYYNENTQSQSKKDCIACSINMVTFDSSSTSLSDCVCQENFYIDPMNSQNCVSCGLTLNCPNKNMTISQVKPLDNFYLSIVSGSGSRNAISVSTLSCPENACSNGTCLPPFGGYLCSSCLPFSNGIGSYKYGNIQSRTVCTTCFNSSLLNGLDAFLATLAGFLILSYQIYTNKTKSEKVVSAAHSNKSNKDIVVNTKSLKSLVMKIAINHLQVITIVGQFPFSWPSFVISMFDLSNSVSSGGGVSINLGGGLKCLAIYSHSIDIPLPVRQLISDLLTYVLYSLFICLVWLKLRKGKDRDSAIFISLVVLSFNTYPSFVRDFFQLFSCLNFNTGDGSRRLAGALDVICYSKEHLFWIYSLALPFCFIILIGFPLFASFNLLKASTKGELESNSILSKWGFLYDGHKTGYWGWEFVVLSRKIALSVVAVFFIALPKDNNTSGNSNTNDAYYEQGMAGMLVIVIAFGLQLACNPYINNEFNQMEALGLIVSYATLYLGSWTFASAVSNSTQLFITFSIVVINLVWLLFGIYKLRFAVLETLKMIFYKVKSLCNNNCKRSGLGNKENNEIKSSDNIINDKVDNNNDIAMVDINRIKVEKEVRGKFNDDNNNKMMINPLHIKKVNKK